MAKVVQLMKRAIRDGDVAVIGKLAEEGSLNLHASTMTGKAHMVLWEHQTLQIIREVQKMRIEGLPAWFSMDTGPSMFVNTYTENVNHVAKRLLEAGFPEAINSKVGDRPKLS